MEFLGSLSFRSPLYEATNMSGVSVGFDSLLIPSHISQDGVRVVLTHLNLGNEIGEVPDDVQIRAVGRFDGARLDITGEGNGIITTLSDTFPTFRLTLDTKTVSAKTMGTLKNHFDLGLYDLLTWTGDMTLQFTATKRSNNLPVTITFISYTLSFYKPVTSTTIDTSGGPVDMNVVRGVVS